MTRRAVRVLVAAVFATALLALPAFGAEDLTVSDRDAEDYPEVSVTVTPPDTLSGTPLEPGDFSLTEGGKPVENFVVEPIRSESLDVILLLDSSGSMRGEPIDEAKEAAESFIRQMPKDVRISVLGLGPSLETVTSFLDKRAEHIEGIRGLEAEGQENLFDSVEAAANRFSDDGRRHVVVLLSDGADDSSTTTASEAFDALEEVDATVYAVQFLTPEGKRSNLDTLARGGTVVPVADADALKGVYDQIAADLISQYRIVWESDATGPTDITLAVRRADVEASVDASITLPGAADPGATATPAPAPAPDPRVAAPPRGLAQAWALYAGGGLVFLGLALILTLALLPSRRRSVLQHGEGVAGASIHRGLSELTEQAVLLADRGLQARKVTSGLNTSLERAGINLRPAEFLVLAVSVVLTGMAIGGIFGGIWLALGIGVITGILTRLFISFRADRRRAKFADQLNDTLQLLSGSLRAGYGMLQAIDSVAREADSPTAEEFRRLVVETRLGRDFTTSLEAMATRLGNDDFHWVVQAIAIHREVGGDLAEVLDTVAATIRERNQIRRQIKSLSAEGRLSGVILCLVPPAVGLMINIINPGYLEPLWTTVPGLIALVGGLILMVIGVFWMKKIVKLVF